MDSKTVSLADEVSSEVIDDEVMIMNLANGKYYSMQGSGLEIWEALREGQCTATIAARLVAGHAGDSEVIGAEVSRLVSELEQEGLVTVSDASGEPAVSTDSVQQGSTPFTPPQLNVYTDMEELLLLDPIHDVDGRGWPHRPADDPD